MSFWIAVIGSKLTKDRFLTGDDNWFCLPQSCEIGDQVMMYIARKASNNPGILAVYKVIGRDNCKDNLCRHYGMLSGTGERPVYVALALHHKFNEVIPFAKIKQLPALSSTIFVRRNFQATYFKITSREFQLLASIGGLA